MSNIETDIIKKMIKISEKFKKYGDSNLFLKRGINSQQFIILSLIVENGEISINKMKKDLMISPAALSQTLSKLETLGLITRNISSEDKREIMLKCTKKGEDLFKDLYKEYSSLVVSKMKTLSDKDKSDIDRLINILNDIDL